MLDVPVPMSPQVGLLWLKRSCNLPLTPYPALLAGRDAAGQQGPHEPPRAGGGQLGVARGAALRVEIAVQGGGRPEGHGGGAPLPNLMRVQDEDNVMDQ
jgi:hypothetical protein